MPRPRRSRSFYERFVALLRERAPQVETGEFGATMDVELVNDGPVTLISSDDASPIVLASASPAPHRVAGHAGPRGTSAAPERQRDAARDESPAAHVERPRAPRPLQGASQRPDALVIGADTVVVSDGDVLGKPARRQDAVATLAPSRGEDHVVFSGLAIATQRAKCMLTSVDAAVWFRSFDEALARRYVSTASRSTKRARTASRGSAPR